MNRRRVKFDIQFLTLFLCLSLSLSSSALALRNQQQEDPSQLGGLEEALKDPGKALYRVAELVVPPVSPTIPLSPARAAGLEEGLRPGQQAFLDKWRTRQENERKQFAESLNAALTDRIQEITDRQLAAVIREISLLNVAPQRAGVLAKLGYTAEQMLPLAASSLRAKGFLGASPPQPHEIMQAGMNFLKSLKTHPGANLIVTEADIKRLGLHQVAFSVPGWPETSLIRSTDVEFLNQLLTLAENPNRVSSGIAGALPEIRWGQTLEEEMVVENTPLRIRIFTTFRSASPFAWGSIGTHSERGVEIYRPVIREIANLMSRATGDLLMRRPPEFFRKIDPENQTALVHLLSDPEQAAQDFEFYARVHEAGHAEAERRLGEIETEARSLSHEEEVSTRLSNKEVAFEIGSLLELLAEFAPQEGFYSRTGQMAKEDAPRAYRILTIGWLNLSSGGGLGFSHHKGQEFLERELLQQVLEAGPEGLSERIDRLLSNRPFDQLGKVLTDVTPEVRLHVTNPQQLSPLLENAGRRVREILLASAGLEEDLKAQLRKSVALEVLMRTFIPASYEKETFSAIQEAIENHRIWLDNSYYTLSGSDPFYPFPDRPDSIFIDRNRGNTKHTEYVDKEAIALAEEAVGQAAAGQDPAPGFNAALSKAYSMPETDPDFPQGQLQTLAGIAVRQAATGRFNDALFTALERIFDPYYQVRALAQIGAYQAAAGIDPEPLFQAAWLRTSHIHPNEGYYKSLKLQSMGEARTVIGIHRSVAGLFFPDQFSKAAGIASSAEFNRHNEIERWCLLYRAHSGQLFGALLSAREMGPVDSKNILGELLSRYAATQDSVRISYQAYSGQPFDAILAAATGMGSVDSNDILGGLLSRYAATQGSSKISSKETQVTVSDFLKHIQARTLLALGILYPQNSERWHHDLVRLRDQGYLTPQQFNQYMSALAASPEFREYGIMPGGYGDVLIKWLGVLPREGTRIPQGLRPLKIIADEALTRYASIEGVIPAHLAYADDRSYPAAFRNLWIFDEEHQKIFPIGGRRFVGLGLAMDGSAALYLDEATGSLCTMCINMNRTQKTYTKDLLVILEKAYTRGRADAVRDILAEMESQEQVRAILKLADGWIESLPSADQQALREPIAPEHNWVRQQTNYLSYVKSEMQRLQREKSQRAKKYFFDPDKRGFGFNAREELNYVPALGVVFMNEGLEWLAGILGVPYPPSNPRRVLWKFGMLQLLYQSQLILNPDLVIRTLHALEMGKGLDFYDPLASHREALKEKIVPTLKAMRVESVQEYRPQVWVEGEPVSLEPSQVATSLTPFLQRHLPVGFGNGLYIWDQFVPASLLSDYVLLPGDAYGLEPQNSDTPQQQARTLRRLLPDWSHEGESNAAGLEEGRAALLDFVARHQSTIDLLTEGRLDAANLADYFPKLKLDELARKAGYREGLVQTLPLIGLPSAFVGNAVPVFVQDKEDWREKIEASLSGAVARRAIRFVYDPQDAYLVIGEEGAVPLQPGQVFLGVNNQTVSELTKPDDPRFEGILQDLQQRGLLEPGSIVILYPAPKDSVLIFA